MNDERAFWAAIDAATRAVVRDAAADDERPRRGLKAVPAVVAYAAYADWLADRDDPREAGHRVVIGRGWLPLWDASRSEYAIWPYTGPSTKPSNRWSFAVDELATKEKFRRWGVAVVSRPLARLLDVMARGFAALPADVRAELSDLTREA